MITERTTSPTDANADGNGKEELSRGGDGGGPSAEPPPKRGDDPGPEGPEGERVGEDEKKEADDSGEPSGAGGLGPSNPGPDANPIDPRVF
jgi:hypothetical protein